MTREDHSTAPGASSAPRLAAALTLALATLATACSTPLTADECNALLDHYTDLLVKSQREDATPEELLRLRREARTRAAASREFARCPVAVSRAQFQCAMQASAVDDVEKCLL